jgi:branched-chain amino acid transport system permease protein
MATEALAGRAIAMKTEARRRQATALLIVAGAVLLALLPFAGVRSFTITLLTEALIFAIWAMSLDLMTGYTGMLTFGHAAGFGLGGYAAGYFAREVTADFVASLLVAELVILSVAVPIGFVAIRLSGAAFAIVSLCIAQVFFQIAVAWRSVTEGMDGLVGVPLPTVLGRTINVGTEFYLLTVLIAGAVCLGLRQLVISPFGRTLGAIRVNEDRAAAIGINIRLHKWLVFVMSWAIAGVGGTLMVFMKAGTTPMSLYWIESGNVLIMAIFGGLGTLFGPVVGAVSFVFLRDALTTGFEVWQLAFGVVFVIVVLVFPSGLAGIVSRVWMLLWRARS